MNILVTGANGFVGTHLCHRLLERGHTVYGLIRNPRALSLTHPHFILIQGDLSAIDQASLPDTLDACIHTAGLVHSFNPQDFFRVNTQGTKNLIHALKTKYPSHIDSASFKFIFLSSLAAAGPCPLGEKKEELELDFPVSQYGLSKKQAEKIVQEYTPKEWTTSIIRPPMIIGPGDKAVLDIFKMVKSRLIILPGTNSCHKEYSFVCVFDLIETILLVLDSPKPLFLYSAFNRVITFQNLIDEIKTKMNIRLLLYLPIPLVVIHSIGKMLAFIYRFFPHHLRLTPDKIHELSGMAWTCDNSQSQQKLGQHYHYSLKKTIELTYHDYQKRHWL